MPVHVSKFVIVWSCADRNPLGPLSCKFAWTRCLWPDHSWLISRPFSVEEHRLFTNNVMIFRWHSPAEEGFHRNTTSYCELTSSRLFLQDCSECPDFFLHKLKICTIWYYGAVLHSCRNVKCIHPLYSHRYVCIVTFLLFKFRPLYPNTKPNQFSTVKTWTGK